VLDQFVVSALGIAATLLALADLVAGTKDFFWGSYVDMNNAGKCGSEVRDLPVFANSIKKPRASMLTVRNQPLSNVDWPVVVRFLVKTIAESLKYLSAVLKTLCGGDLGQIPTRADLAEAVDLDEHGCKRGLPGCNRSTN
jgi:hypothetical protein